MKNRTHTSLQLMLLGMEIYIRKEIEANHTLMNLGCNVAAEAYDFYQKALKDLKKDLCLSQSIYGHRLYDTFCFIWQTIIGSDYSDLDETKAAFFKAD